jgi:hypothetical protein
MCDQMRSHTAVGEIHQVESRCTRGKGEVSDADEVSGDDAVVMSLQSIERTPKQAGSHLAVDTFWSSDRDPSSCRPTSKSGKSKSEEKTTRKYQDV